MIDIEPRSSNIYELCIIDYSCLVDGEACSRSFSFENMKKPRSSTFNAPESLIRVLRDGRPFARKISERCAFERNSFPGRIYPALNGASPLTAQPGCRSRTIVSLASGLGRNARDGWA